MVPKAYYADIIWNYVVPYFDHEKSNIEIVTVNRFDENCVYDQILVIGNLVTKHFDIFRCMSAAKITILLYKAEEIMFRVRERRSHMMEKLINARQCMADDCDDENEENSFAEEVDEVEKVDEKIATYTDEIITKKFETVLHREGGNTAALFAGCFCT